jgi:hypothetical protein
MDRKCLKIVLCPNNVKLVNSTLRRESFLPSESVSWRNLFAELAFSDPSTVTCGDHTTLRIVYVPVSPRLKGLYAILSTGIRRARSPTWRILEINVTGWKITCMIHKTTEKTIAKTISKTKYLLDWKKNEISRWSSIELRIWQTRDGWIFDEYTTRRAPWLL